MRQLSRPACMAGMQAALALVAVALLTVPAFSAPPQHKVFTNDDVVSTRPPTPPATAAAPAEASQPSAEASQAQASPTSPDQTEVQRLQTILDAMGQASDFLNAKVQQGAAEQATMEHWSQVSDSLSLVLSQFRQFLAEAQAKAEADRAAAAAASTQPAQQ
jgi:hypothetical protein